MNTVNLLILSFCWFFDNGLEECRVLDKVSCLFCGDDSAMSVGFEVRLPPGDTWRRFGFTTKALAVVNDLIDVEYCGATSLLLHGFYVRKPRIKKFLDQLRWSVHEDPRYVFERARGIMCECFPVEPVYKYVKRFLLWMKRQHPELAGERLPSEQELLFLYTGLEASVGRKHGTDEKVFVLQGCQ
jgi:hypothetical protein